MAIHIYCFSQKHLFSDMTGANLFYPARATGSDAIQQGGYQVAATFVAFGIAIAGGLVTGVILKSPLFRQPRKLFLDEIFRDAKTETKQKQNNNHIK